MRRKLRSTLSSAAVVGLLLAVLPNAASATPSRGVTGVTIFEHVVGDTDYVLREVTIAPGGTTGWHYHPGPVYGYVKEGLLNHYDSSCASDGVYRAGQVISEASGPGYVHIGRNLSDKPLVIEAFYQNPVGQPLAVDAPNPGCPFE
ncbi:cupin domain-containing protein [Saccharothrix syringae]|uniref:Cupin domain-containing protein n=1 Tax=Saccharothrix syringae TaxID=103733 RepID=A0A5Q0GZ06_SACSY|nr:cupin domain-containing protein [Saccharothrix syringae]QFZ18895.1 cupin domain-containing protein [Saccharothrix syringae]